MLINESMKHFADTGHQGVYQLTRLLWEEPGRMMGRNIDLMQAFVRESGNEIGQAWNEISRVSPLTDWPAVMNTTLQCAAAINQLALQTASRAYTEATGQSLAMFPTLPGKQPPSA